ncbi:MAG TPA: hypothetical protein VJK30_04890 [Coxiellaceae bacterium]|nr:MAG: hypothetical protein A3E81_00530 [Gammaproteobacteria bacterium RIFCSPHIGHO2_12_FULL_36_30]HLB56644.1 hypothetical protein [Coxiellaceae bacterium]
MAQLVKLYEPGFILFIVLIFLFVLTLTTISSSQDIILENKMQNNMENSFSVFARAELGMQQAVLAQENDPIVLPDSPISLNVTSTVIAKDSCDNKIIDMQSTAKNNVSTVVLNSRNIFAKVPRQKGCKKISKHQILWWREL